MPFWAFSDEVSPATIVDGKLQTNSTGGTSMSSVLQHIAKERPLCAVVITDGYIESVSQALLEKTKGTKITAIVTRKGSTSEIEHAGIPCIQLGSYPGGN
jgi:predicted metal-dependent peptidase